MYVHANPIKVGESRKHVSGAEWDPLLSSQCKLTAGSGRNVKKQKSLHRATLICKGFACQGEMCDMK